MANLDLNVTSEQNLTMTRGDTFAFGIEIEGNTQELDAAYLTVKKDIDADVYVFQKSLEDGISIVETGDDSISYRVRIAPNDTKNLEAGKYPYDLELRLNGDVFTPIKGVLYIEKDVTRKEQ